MLVDQIRLSSLKRAGETRASYGAEQGAPADVERLAQACREFEGLLLGQMMRQMRGGLSDRGLIPSSPAAEVFWNQYCQALGQELSLRNPLGLADMLSRNAAGHEARRVNYHED